MILNREVYIVGAGGHAKSISSFIDARKKIFFIDKKKKIKQNNLIGDDIFFFENIDISKKFDLFMGIGLPNQSRIDVFNLYKKNKFNFTKLIHKSAVVNKNSSIGEGSIIFPNVTIGNNVKIGVNSIIYSNASVEHDTIIGDHCYISPSATICGNVIVGNNVFVGANACVIEKVKIKNNTFVKANKLLK